MQTARPPKVLPEYSHSQKLQPIAELVSHMLRQKKSQNALPKLTKSEKALITTRIANLDAASQIDGVDFSRCVPAQLLRHHRAGGRIEFETIGPYLADYVAYDGYMSELNLTPEDVIGLRLAESLSQIFTNATPVALIDDYNAQQTAGEDASEIGHFSAEQIKNLRQSFTALLVSRGVIPKNAVEGDGYILVSEASKASEAEKLVAKLEAMHSIRRHGKEIILQNTRPEHPLLSEFHLRTKTGKWLCHTMDAAAFLHPRNLDITHLIVLPLYMKIQQDKVWEILRLFGFDPERYHNIFYNPSGEPSAVANTVERVFKGTDK